ncbi:hypothetical protein XENOCAPTIV_029273 [Xenoophorus captivus]|uniref:Uncharacterized protein n=1 Tax=Xenoophorus captivus TaxID=1517983 RepID=A0ABV0S3S6_9TELE
MHCWKLTSYSLKKSHDLPRVLSAVIFPSSWIFLSCKQGKAVGAFFLPADWQCTVTSWGGMAQCIKKYAPLFSRNTVSDQLATGASTRCNQRSFQNLFYCKLLIKMTLNGRNSVKINVYQ